MPFHPWQAARSASWFSGASLPAVVLVMLLASLGNGEVLRLQRLPNFFAIDEQESILAAGFMPNQILQLRFAPCLHGCGRARAETAEQDRENANFKVVDLSIFPGKRARSSVD